MTVVEDQYRNRIETIHKSIQDRLKDTEWEDTKSKLREFYWLYQNGAINAEIYYTVLELFTYTLRDGYKVLKK
jgi:hypothetical protein